jgi:hypothetical protein
MTTALEEIDAERRRQVESEGWTAAHDDDHDAGELAAAAATYAINAACVLHPLNGTPIDLEELPFVFWPWDKAWWKPKSPRRDLVRAAALIVAELERLERADSRIVTERTQFQLAGGLTIVADPSVPDDEIRVVYPADALAALRRLFEAVVNGNDPEAMREAQRALDHARTAVGTVPRGWKLVPENVTPEMQRAYFDVIDENMRRVETDVTFGRYANAREAYRAMLKAAPTPPGVKAATRSDGVDQP